MPSQSRPALPTMAQHNLNTLPDDIVFDILGHLPVDYRPSIHQSLRRATPRRWSHTPSSNGLLAISLTTRNLRRLAEMYAQHQLHVLRERFPAKAVAAVAAPPRAPETHRGIYLRHARTRCFNCDSARAMGGATLYPRLPCCRSCDRELWPYTMSVDAAADMYLVEPAALARAVEVEWKGRQVDERAVRVHAVQHHAGAVGAISAAERDAMTARLLGRWEQLKERIKQGDGVRFGERLEFVEEMMRMYSIPWSPSPTYED